MVEETKSFIKSFVPLLKEKELEEVKYFFDPNNVGNDIFKYYLKNHHIVHMRSCDHYDKFIEYLQLAIDKNDVNAMCLLGQIYIKDSKTKATGIKLFQRAGELGYKKAIIALVNLYIYQRIEKNEEDFRYWLQKLSEFNDPDDLMSIGYTFSRQLDDNTTAFQYFEKSANLGNPESIYRIGYCYHNGIGTTKNLTEAIKYYQLSAKLGYHQAIEELKELKKEICYQPMCELFEKNNKLESQVSELTKQNEELKAYDAHLRAYPGIGEQYKQAEQDFILLKLNYNN